MVERIRSTRRRIMRDFVVKEISAVELTDAYIAAVEGAKALNAYIVETPANP